MLSPAALALLDRRGYTPEMIAAEGLVEYDRGEFFIGTSTFWVPEPSIVFTCKSTSGQLFAYHTCALDRKEYRLRRDPMLPWIPSCYGSSDDYEIMFTTRTVVLCEGIFDRTALKRCLPDHAVLARLTKGLSANLMVMLERFCSKVILAFDMDEPGRTSAAQSARRLKKVGLSTHVLSYPAHDPSDLYQQRGVVAAQDVFSKAVKFLL